MHYTRNTDPNMSECANPEVERVLREAVREQVATNDPPEVAQTLARLQQEGISEDEAVRWIAAALLQEMNIMLRDNRQYNHSLYVAALSRLPGRIDR